MQYLQARYYDPQTSQFLTVDPLAGLTGEPYAYTDDDPLDGTYPAGLCSLAASKGKWGLPHVPTDATMGDRGRNSVFFTRLMEERGGKPEVSLYFAVPSSGVRWFDFHFTFRRENGQVCIDIVDALPRGGKKKDYEPECRPDANFDAPNASVGQETMNSIAGSIANRIGDVVGGMCGDPAKVIADPLLPPKHGSGLGQILWDLQEESPGDTGSAVPIPFP